MASRFGIGRVAVGLCSLGAVAVVACSAHSGNGGITQSDVTPSPTATSAPTQTPPAGGTGGSPVAGWQVAPGPTTPPPMIIATQPADSGVKKTCGAVQVPADVDEVPQAAANGFALSADYKTATLTGSICDGAKSGAYSNFSFQYGCVTVPPLPIR